MNTRTTAPESLDREQTDTGSLEQAIRWQAENGAFIAAYNQVVEVEGLPLEAWRMF